MARLEGDRMGGYCLVGTILIWEDEKNLRQMVVTVVQWEYMPLESSKLKSG